MCEINPCTISAVRVAPESAGVPINENGLQINLKVLRLVRRADLFVRPREAQLTFFFFIF